jgi:hypothetical protein
MFMRLTDTLQGSSPAQDVRDGEDAGLNCDPGPIIYLGQLVFNIRLSTSSCGIWGKALPALLKYWDGKHTAGTIAIVVHHSPNTEQRGVEPSYGAMPPKPRSQHTKTSPSHIATADAQEGGHGGLECLQRGIEPLQ